jgi:hypothetical protein
MIYDKEKFDSLYHSVNAMISSSNIRKNIKTERNTERTVPASLGAADLNDFTTFQAATLIRHMHDKNWCPMKEYAPLNKVVYPLKGISKRDTGLPSGKSKIEYTSHIYDGHNH